MSYDHKNHIYRNKFRFSASIKKSYKNYFKMLDNRFKK